MLLRCCITPVIRVPHVSLTFALGLAIDIALVPDHVIVHVPVGAHHIVLFVCMVLSLFCVWYCYGCYACSCYCYCGCLRDAH